MLKLAGTQRYATQMTCRLGKRDFLPLDGSGDIDALRKSVDLGPASEYRQTMDRVYGPCPK